MGAATLGKTCMMMILASLHPTARADSMYWFDMMEMVEPRMTREAEGALITPSTITTLSRLLPSRKTAINSTTMVGRLMNASTTRWMSMSVEPRK